MAEQPSVISGALKKPFAEQVAYFRGKLGSLVPTQAWNDMTGAAHDRGFMVAGAAKADLLTDLAAATDRSITEGQSLEAFRKDFMRTIERRGWSGFTGDESAARRAWRTRTIYTTNATTSYNAGREAQITAAGYPLAIYKHNDSVAHPRPEHLAWNGLTLPVGHPFWQTHSPQNGWGCKCYKLGARSERGARRLGGDPGQQLPEGWNAIDPKTGAPVGIDKGWDYAPGASVAAEVSKMAAKTVQWDYQLAKAYMQEVPNRDALARAYRSLPSVADDVRRYANRIIEGRTHLEIPPYRTIGLLTTEDAAKVKELIGHEVEGFDFAIDQSGVRHVDSRHGPGAGDTENQRPVVAGDYAHLPAVLNAPDVVEYAGVAKTTQLPLVRYRKLIGDEDFEAVMEVRGGRKMMVMQTYYIPKR